MTTSPPPNFRRKFVRDTHVTMAHGGGGRAMRDLIDAVFTSVFQPPGSEDQARLMTEALQVPGARLTFTTDSFVVTPLEFPGGNIGKLAVCGRVNDLAVGGAKPLWLSAAFVVEEGCEIALLHRITATMAHEADRAGVRIVTGDTKVVERGKGDGVFITTAGIGVIPPGLDIGAARIGPGDVAVVNGDHGAAILAARGDLALSTDLQSDCASPGHLMQVALTAAPGITAARDCTRGGLASARNEMAAEAVVAALRALREGQGACILGRALAGEPGRVTLRTAFGGARILDMLVGEQLPRIC
jgi:hydrogenase expression/formation protein HypE